MSKEFLLQVFKDENDGNLLERCACYNFTCHPSSLAEIQR